MVGSLIASIAQVLLKKEAIQKHSSYVKEYLNYNVIIAYSAMLFTTFLAVLAYKIVPLSLGPILESTSYIFVTLFGVLFNEQINKLKLLALVFIITGIAFSVLV